MMPTVPAYSDGDTAIQINPATNAVALVRMTILWKRRIDPRTVGPIVEVRSLVANGIFSPLS